MGVRANYVMGKQVRDFSGIYRIPLQNAAGEEM
jgi:hypothetical protein